MIIEDFYFIQVIEIIAFNFTVGVEKVLLDCLSLILSWLMKCGSVPKGKVEP